MVTSSNLAHAAAAYEGFATGNMEPLFSSLAPDVMWTNHSHSDSPFMGVYEGPVGVQQFFGHMPEIELEQHDVLSMIEKEEYRCCPYPDETNHQGYRQKSCWASGSCTQIPG